MLFPFNSLQKPQFQHVRAESLQFSGFVFRVTSAKEHRVGQLEIRNSKLETKMRFCPEPAACSTRLNSVSVLA
jgi:hypothetical protein